MGYVDGFFFYLELLIRKEVYFFGVKYKLEMYYFIYRMWFYVI